MWPWGHAAVGYLLYAAYRRYRDGRAPTDAAAIAVVVASQLPDLVDKPLAWTLEVLASGRSLAHSWLTATVVLAAAWWYLDDSRWRALVVPFGIGWVSHGVGDGLYSVLTWEPRYLGFVLWPVTSAPPPEIDQSFAAHLLALEFDWFAGLQLALVAVALAVWHRDGHPGVAPVVAALRDAAPVDAGGHR